jgi:ribosomal protein S27AE
VTEPRRPALLGLTAYLLVGLTIGVTHLIAHGAFAIHRIANNLPSPLTDSIRDQTGLSLALLAVWIILPVMVAGIAALMGRHAGRTYQRATGPAAITALIGIPLVWVCLAIAALIVGYAMRHQGIEGSWNNTVETLLASLVQLLLILAPLVGLAALVASRAQQWAIDNQDSLGQADHIDVQEAKGGPYGGELATDPDAWLSEEEGEGIYPEGLPEDESPTEDPHLVDPNYIHDQSIDCPRCGSTFIVSGHRPLRITCPDCGKTGTIN